MKRKPYIAMILLIASLPIFSSSANAGERENAEIAAAIKQLQAVKSALERAKKARTTEDFRRLYFDYENAFSDIKTIEKGLLQYLNPSRAEINTKENLYNLGGNYLKTRKRK